MVSSPRFLIYKDDFVKVIEGLGLNRTTSDCDSVESNIYDIFEKDGIKYEIISNTIFSPQYAEDTLANIIDKYGFDTDAEVFIQKILKYEDPDDLHI